MILVAVHVDHHHVALSFKNLPVITQEGFIKNRGLSMNITELGNKIYFLLHNTPEISGNENHTRQIIRKIITKNNNINVILDSPLGIVAEYRVDNKKEYDLGFRAELDAIKLSDDTTYHGCGHDAHITSLLLFILWINREHVNKNLLFVFQSSEEAGNGAKDLVSLMKNKKIHVGKMISIHNAPEISSQCIAVRSGKLLADNVTFEINICLREMGHFSEEDFFDFSKFINILRKLFCNGYVVRINHIESNGTVSVYPDKIDFLISIRSLVFDTRKIIETINELKELIMKFNNVTRVAINVINNHINWNNSEGLCKKLKSIPKLKVLKAPESYSSDDFGYYKFISREMCYFFVGSYLSDEYSKIHTDRFKVNPEFIKTTFFVYKYLMKEL